MVSAAETRNRMLKKFEYVSEIIIRLKSRTGSAFIKPSEAQTPAAAVASVRMNTGHFGCRKRMTLRMIATRVPPKTQKYGRSALNCSIESVSNSGRMMDVVVVGIVQFPQ